MKRYPDHSWTIHKRYPLRNGKKEGFVWKCVRCQVELAKTETGHPLLSEVIENEINLDCSMQAAKDVMES
jgi:hypothetical protein